MESRIFLSFNLLAKLINQAMLYFLINCFIFLTKFWVLQKRKSCSCGISAIFFQCWFMSETQVLMAVSDFLNFFSRFSFFFFFWWGDGGDGDAAPCPSRGNPAPFPNFVHICWLDLVSHNSSHETKNNDRSFFCYCYLAGPRPTLGNFVSTLCK